jgi:hypothetical protein
MARQLSGFEPFDGFLLLMAVELRFAAFTPLRARARGIKSITP